MPPLRDAEPRSLGRICATAASCRSQHSHRLAVLGSTTGEIAERLESSPLPPRGAAGDCASEAAAGAARVPVLGNGPQWWRMGCDLPTSTAVSCGG